MKESIMTNNITNNLAQLKPDTLALMVADCYNDVNADMEVVKKLVWALEELTGDESSIDYLVDAGINANIAVGMFDN
jgi:hypothetical protein